MLLNIWNSIRDYFSSAFTNFSIGHVISLLMGIVLGFIIALLIYVISILKGISDTKKRISKEQIDVNGEKEKEEKVNEVINEATSRYDDMSKDVGFKELYEIEKDIIYTMIVDIAKIYNPKSKHPLTELSMLEVIELDRYVADRVDELLNKKGLRFLKNINISDILAAKDAFDRFDDNRFVRKAKKFHAGSIGEVFSSIKNAINPSYWGRKAVTNVSKKVALNKIARLIIKIVGNGSAMVYSKHLFNTDENSINNESDAIVIDANNDID